MPSFPPRLRYILLASACTTAFTAHADVLSKFTLTADNAAIGEVGIEQASLLDSTFRDEGVSAGSVFYRYVFQGFTPDTPSDYVFGQTSSLRMMIERLVSEGAR